MNDTKILGDSGEHYALSMLGFAGFPCSKLPDNWKFYDLIVQKGGELIRISVKTRSETEKFSRSSWFIFDSTGQYEWVVFILKMAQGEVRAWIIPLHVALKYASVPSESAKSPNDRRISWGKLEKPGLVKYLDNWQLNTHD